MLENSLGKDFFKTTKQKKEKTRQDIFCCFFLLMHPMLYFLFGSFLFSIHPFVHGLKLLFPKFPKVENESGQRSNQHYFVGWFLCVDWSLLHKERGRFCVQINLSISCLWFTTSRNSVFYIIADFNKSGPTIYHQPTNRWLIRESIAFF